MDWDRLRVFHAVAEVGSFTHAGEVLSLSQSAVSRQISSLEESLGVPLFHRHARGLNLTEQGELLYRTAREIFAKLAMTEGLLAETKDRPRGPLKVTTTHALGSTRLIPFLRDFKDQYPEIELTVILDERKLDLSMREADVAIRWGAPQQPDLIQRRLATAHFHIYATEEYLKRRGTPGRVEDLDAHSLITYGNALNAPIADINWLMDLGARAGKTRKPILQVNSIYAIFRAVESGLGIASLPDYLAAQSDHLVRVLPDVEGPPTDIYFVYPEELRASKRIGVFRDFLIQKVDEVQAELSHGRAPAPAAASSAGRQ